LEIWLYGVHGFHPKKMGVHSLPPQLKKKLFLGYMIPPAFFCTSKCSYMLLNIFKCHHKSWKLSFSANVYFKIWVRIFTLEFCLGVWYVILLFWQKPWCDLLLFMFSMVVSELSHALYQHDAACRVIARLNKEVTAAREGEICHCSQYLFPILKFLFRERSDDKALCE
jgi:hypothetical protein